MSTTVKPDRPPASGGVKQLTFLFVFLGVLGSVFFLREYLPEQKRLDREAALKRYSFYLEEVSEFFHRVNTQDQIFIRILGSLLLNAYKLCQTVYTDRLFDRTSFLPP